MASPVPRSIACLALLLLLTPAAPAEPRPNIVLILADDLGYGDVGCYGSDRNRTPRIDALAAGGVRFTDFHSTGPMCTPTRAALLTGRYPQRFGVAFEKALSPQSAGGHGLPHEAFTLAEFLEPLGYATACFGKWHLGYEPPWLPTSQGFGEFRGLASGDGDHHTHIDRSGREDWWHDDRIEMEEGYTADLLTRHGLRFIEANRDRPFFLYLAHLAIHFPWQGPGDPPHRREGTDYHADKWGIIPDPGNVAPHVRGMVEAIDASVGRIVDRLEQLDLGRRTLVVFTSDNGGYLTYGGKFRNISSNGPYRGQKTEVYEGGHRVPTIVSWPGTIRPGVTPATANSIDLFPTLAGLISAPLPADRPLDGLDLSPLLLGGSSLPERALFWRMGDRKAVRRGPWKLCINGKRNELFHLGNDPGEADDLAGRRPDLARDLARELAAWEADVDAGFRRNQP